MEVCQSQVFDLDANERLQPSHFLTIQAIIRRDDPGHILPCEEAKPP